MPVLDIDIYVKSASREHMAGDNSCLYHSLSFCLKHFNLFTNNGLFLRHSLNDYIRDHLSNVIWTTPVICETFAEAIVGDGSNLSDYHRLMSLSSSWGGVIEICAVVEMFHVAIHIYCENADSSGKYKLLGTFKYTNHDAHTTSLHLLYTGNNHYDSLIDIVIMNENNNGVLIGGDNILEVSMNNYSIGPHISDEITISTEGSFAVNEKRRKPKNCDIKNFFQTKMYKNISIRRTT